MEIVPADLEAFEGRPTSVDHDAVDRLYYLGNYVRELPVSLDRMMENAHDWEHLPFVHPGSFTDIALVEDGPWGWRCKTELPGGGGEQLVELLVDKPRLYWATTVVGGTGQGVQIHTRATQKSHESIEVDVRFYLPQPPETREQGAMILSVLQTQYATLYDEDDALMQGRQTALDRRRDERSAGNPEAFDLGSIDELDPAAVHEVAIARGRFAVRKADDKWIAHAAVCPHMLGPLSDGDIEDGQFVTCPWHGYRFALGDGTEQHGRCGALPEPPQVSLVDGNLIVGP